MKWHYITDAVEVLVAIVDGAQALPAHHRFIIRILMVMARRLAFVASRRS